MVVAIYFDIVASAKFYCNEISGLEAKIVFKCNAYFWLQYTLRIATRTRRRGWFGLGLITGHTRSEQGVAIWSGALRTEKNCGNPGLTRPWVCPHAGLRPRYPPTYLTDSSANSTPHHSSVISSAPTGLVIFPSRAARLRPLLFGCCTPGLISRRRAAGGAGDGGEEQEDDGGVHAGAIGGERGVAHDQAAASARTARGGIGQVGRRPPAHVEETTRNTPL
jgi:hypothetical protein